MQDRYAGDVGDFVKFGLLRALSRADGRNESLRVGVVWCRTKRHDGEPVGDGRHVSYLDPASRYAPHLEACDPDLYRRLADVVREERSIAALEAAGVLPGDTAYFHDIVPPLDSPRTQAARQRALAERSAWHERSLAATQGTDLVFFDPDNGLRPTDDPRRHRRAAAKYIWVDELVPFAERQQGLVVYHHAGRQGTAVEQARVWMDRLDEALSVPPFATVIARRGTTRLFIVVPAPNQRQVLHARLEAFSGAWSDHSDLVWHRAT